MKFQSIIPKTIAGRIAPAHRYIRICGDITNDAKREPLIVSVPLVTIRSSTTPFPLFDKGRRENGCLCNPATKGVLIEYGFYIGDVS